MNNDEMARVTMVVDKLCGFSEAAGPLYAHLKDEVLAKNRVLPFSEGTAYRLFVESVDVIRSALTDLGGFLPIRSPKGGE